MIRKVKRPLSLLEVMIGLVLSTILLTALFSSFRELMQKKAELAKMHGEKHWEYVTEVRLNQIFEAINSESIFRTEPYRDIAPQSLHFTFNNGVDSDPKFCQQLEGYLFVNHEKEFCLMIESKEGKQRKEVFLKNGSNFSIQFFDPAEKKWLLAWDQNFLPPFVKISISGKVFEFILPHADRTVIYK